MSDAASIRRRKREEFRRMEAKRRAKIDLNIKEREQAFKKQQDAEDATRRRYRRETMKDQTTTATKLSSRVIHNMSPPSPDRSKGSARRIPREQPRLQQQLQQQHKQKQVAPKTAPRRKFTFITDDRAKWLDSTPEKNKYTSKPKHLFQGKDIFASSSQVSHASSLQDDAVSAMHSQTTQTSIFSSVYSSDSDDESDDLLEAFRQRKQKAAFTASQQLASSVNVSAEMQTCNGKYGKSSSHESDMLHSRRKRSKSIKKASKPIATKNSRESRIRQNIRESLACSDSSDTDDGIVERWSQPPVKKRSKADDLSAESAKQVCKIPGETHRTSTVTAETHKVADEVILTDTTKKVNNDEDAKDVDSMAVVEKSKKKKNNNHDDLWSDSENEDVQKEEEPASKRGSKKGKKKKSVDSKKQKKSLSPRKDLQFSYNYNDDHEEEDLYTLKEKELLTRRPNEIKAELHPELSTPHFGPYSMNPLLLHKENDDSMQSDQVPAALTRYLPEFQREGVQFMYSALQRKQGVILGDDMGCGKTVQVISLLCALFQKKGTGEDLLGLQKRQHIITEKLKLRKKEKEAALLRGQLIRGDQQLFDDKFKRKELKLPSWCPVVVIVPVTTVANWKNEFKLWGHFGVAAFIGDRRQAALDRIRNGRAEIMLAPTTIFTQKDDFKELLSIDWKLIIIDEFHVFKNNIGTRSKRLRELKSRGSLVLGMTGTLMQNNHSELWNLVDLAEEGYLGTLDEFNNQIGNPIKYGRTKSADKRTIERSNVKGTALTNKLSTIFIQRLKKDVLADALPQKNEQVVLCDLSPLQKKIYQHVLSLPDFEILRLANSPCDCNANRPFFVRYLKLESDEERLVYYRDHKSKITKRKNCCYRIPINPRRGKQGDPDFDPSQPLIDPDAVMWTMHGSHQDHKAKQGCKHCPSCCLFPALHKVYKLSSHVALLQAKKTSGSFIRGSPEYIKHTEDLQFARVAFPPEIKKKLPGGLYRELGIMDDHFAMSGKMKVLDKLLKKFEVEGSKVLLFSMSTQTLDLIESYVRANFSYRRMDGSTSAKQRTIIADQFRKDKNILVFLLSTKAMGLGINLVEANKVIIFDVDWNPSSDEQAQDRAYRIGQKKDVQVLRLVSRGTIDELKYLRQLYKVQLKQETLLKSTAPKTVRMFRGVQGDKARQGELFGAENLLNFKDGAFLDDIWKKDRRRSAGGKSAEMEIHGGLELHKSFKKIEESHIENVLLGETKSLQIPDKLRLQAESDAPASPPGETKGTREKVEVEGRASPETNDQTSNMSMMEFGDGTINHDDLFCGGEDDGDADADADIDLDEEEMGMETQNAVATIRKGAWGDNSDDDDDSDGDDCVESYHSFATQTAMEDME